MTKPNVSLFLGYPPKCQKCDNDAKVEITLADGRIVKFCQHCLAAIVANAI